MPRFYACDHCGRTGVTFGVYYPNKDMTQPALRLCQSQDGTPIEPSCYHLVVERGEQVGIRKATAILDTDRHAPKIEGAAIRFDAHTQHGLVLSEVTPGESAYAGQSVPMVMPEATTEAEKGKGIDNPAGATQIPLVSIDSPEGQAMADRDAAEQAAKIMPPTAGKRFSGAEFPAPPEDWRSGPDAEHPSRPFRDGDPRSEGAVAQVAPEPADAPFTPPDPALIGSTEPAPEPASTGPTPAEIAKAAQAKADAEEAARLDAKSVDLNPASDPAKFKTATGAPKKAPAKKAAPTKKTPAKPEDRSPLADVADEAKPQVAAEVAAQQEDAAR